jgi:PIN domain nuclease of toxin-antitoxin system
VLLDTCVLLWLVANQGELSERARDLIRQNAGNLYTSAISAFEIGVKHRKGALALPLPPEQWIAEALEHHGIRDIPVDWRIAARSTALPPLHRDPCDRIIVATALVIGLRILSPDRLIGQYSEAGVVW